jgi:6-phosphogluconolactonase
MPIVISSDPDELAHEAAGFTAGEFLWAVRQRGAFYLALAGGETPRGCYTRLASEPYKTGLPWDKAFVFWSDERRVPLTDAQSNFRMAKEALLDHVAVPKDHVFPLQGTELPAALQKSDEGLPRFDLIHLGMGEDGHTASLFPGDPALDDRAEALLAVHNASKPPPERFTFSLPLINAARAVLFLVAGEKKKDALKRVLARDQSLPAARVSPEKGTLRFCVDKAAFGM